MDIGRPVKQAYIKGKYFGIQIHREYIVNTETFDFVSKERPNIGFSFVLA